MINCIKEAMDITTIFEKEYNYLVGKLQILIEDRRPDLITDEDLKNSGLGYKYKTQIQLSILWFKFSFITHSIDLPCVIVNSKEQTFYK